MRTDKMRNERVEWNHEIRRQEFADSDEIKQYRNNKR